MATDINPCRDSLQMENENFALNLNNKIVRRVEDEAAIEVLNAILTALGGGSGTAFFDYQTATTTPGTEQTLISVTVPASTTRSITRVRVSCRQRLTYKLEVDGIEIGSGRVGAGQYTDDLVFVPNYDVAENLDIVLKVTQTQGKATDVEANLMALDN